MATTMTICPLDLEHILQYSITGWCTGCSGEKSQLLKLLKEKDASHEFSSKMRIQDLKRNILCLQKTEEAGYPLSFITSFYSVLKNCLKGGS